MLQGLVSCVVLQSLVSCVVLQGLVSCVVLQGLVSCVVLQSLVSCVVLQGLVSCVVLQGLVSCVVLHSLVSCVVLQGLVSCCRVTSILCCVAGFTSVVLSSIERRYGFSSVVAGLIASVFDMSVLVSVLFISYFGGRGHKPRWLGISLIIQGTGIGYVEPSYGTLPYVVPHVRAMRVYCGESGLQYGLSVCLSVCPSVCLSVIIKTHHSFVGAFVFSLPQFIFGHYEAGMEENELCQRNESEAESDCSDANNFALVFFFLGNILIGIGAAPLFTIGTSYLDDIVSPKYVSIYLGIFYTCTVVGPALGFGLGGLFLSVYVDPWRETNLEPKDSLWVGAWWMCFVFSGVLSLLISVPFLMFPKLLPNSSTVKAERVKEMAQRYDGKDGGMEEVDLATQVKSFPRHLCQVLKTPSWIFITIAICSSGIVVSGVTSFAPKYFESQFSLTASTASLVAGGVGKIHSGIPYSRDYKYPSIIRTPQIQVPI